MQIVAIDPSRTVRKCLAQLLTQRGHQIAGFADGAEAMRHIAADPDVDAVIVSAEQTDSSGVELCWHLRLMACAYRPLYVILMSSHDGRRTLIEGLDSGADDFISKPPHPDELYARLRAAERVTSMQRELVRLATTDPLTGVMNRRAFFERSIQACEAAQPELPLSAIMLDIDHFKAINDAFGHAVGDEVIRAVAAEAAQTSRMVGRLGGEEFAILVEAEMSSALRTAERLRAAIAALKFNTPTGTVTPTCSFGVSEWQPADTIDDLLRRADGALYAAKAGGRNQVVADQPGLPEVDRNQYQSVIRGPVR